MEKEKSLDIDRGLLKKLSSFLCYAKRKRDRLGSLYLVPRNLKRGVRKAMLGSYKENKVMHTYIQVSKNKRKGESI